jgi:hypothetical protein
MLPRGEERLRGAFSALLKMRRDLAGQGLHFAVFDSVCIGYLHRTGTLTQEKVKALFPAEELDLYNQARRRDSWYRYHSVPVLYFE